MEAGALCARAMSATCRPAALSSPTSAPWPPDQSLPEARWRGFQVPSRKRVEARDGLSAAPLRRAMAGQEPKGGRYLKYRQPLGAYKPSDPTCAVRIESISTLMSVFLASRARQPVAADPAVRWLRRTSDFLASPATVASVVRAGSDVSAVVHLL
jgi:hypothetical protein